MADACALITQTPNLTASDRVSGSAELPRARTLSGIDPPANIRYQGDPNSSWDEHPHHTGPLWLVHMVFGRSLFKQSLTEVLYRIHGVASAEH
ncbi:MAG: hypothetical protein C4K47_02285 [Candidatus Thorarchaeota archaeon]|nr:MAG: hypothetical protein C4K47_02285 [Candidatus Thorarchaeota archaeon]